MTALRPAKDVAACLAYREAKEIKLVGAEQVAGRNTSHVRVTDKFDQQLDFWIEPTSYHVVRCEYRFEEIFRRCQSEYGQEGPASALPTEVRIEEAFEGKRVCERTLKITNVATTDAFPPESWTLAGLDLPVGTPVVKLFETPVDKVTGERIGYWNGKGLSDSPGKRAASE